MIRTLIVCALALGCAGCEHFGQFFGGAKPVIVSDYGVGCKIIKPSRKDTDETLRQIKDENDRCREAKFGQKEGE